MALPPFLIGVAFVALAELTRRRARRLRIEALNQLVGVFLLVGIIGVLSPLTQVSEFVIIPVFTGLMLYPLVLLRFVDAIAPVRPLIRHVAGAGAIFGFLVVGAYVVLGQGSPVVRGLGNLEIMVLLPALVAAAHVVSWRAIAGQATRLRSSFTVQRAFSLNVGLAGLGVGIVVSLVVLDAVGYAISIAAALVLAFATAPPRWLRAAWLVDDLDAIDAAEADYLRRPGDPGALEAYVAAVNRVADGIGTWVVKDRTTIAAVGEPVPEDVRMRRPRDGDFEMDRLVSGQWLLQARTRDVVLRVLAADDPVMFGLNESTLFLRVAGRLAVALEREQFEDEHRQVALLLQEADHLRRMADLKDDVLSTLSHELRTPLTVIGGNAELLHARWDGITDDDRALLLSRIRSHAGALAKTVEDTVRLANLRAGEVRVRPRPVQVQALVGEVVAALDGDDRVRVEVPDAVVHLDGDLVGDVLARLLSNGLKHSGAEVRVTAEVGSDLVLRVHDNGPGFGDLDPAELFTPFNRGGNVLRRETRGMGMGLAVAAATAEVVGATVRIEQTSDEGSTVACVVPNCLVGEYESAG